MIFKTGKGMNFLRILKPLIFCFFRNNKAAGGRIVRAMMIEAIKANVFVNASGRNSFPSAPVIVNTGRNPTTVVATAVKTALPTSAEALWIICSLLSPGLASWRCLRLFSQMTIPISTMVPMAMAIPERATMLASTPNSFMAIKQTRTASGSMELINMELLRFTTRTITTMMVTSISSVRAVSSVPSVS